MTSAEEPLLLHGDPLTLQLRLELHREVVLDGVVVPVVLPHVHVARVLIAAGPVLSGKLFEFVVLLEESEVAGFAVPPGGGGGAALLLLFLLLLVRHFVYLLSRLFQFSSRKSFFLLVR